MIDVPEQCEFRWLGPGLNWGQVTYCHAEFSCPEPPVPPPPGTLVGDPAYTLCTA